MTRNDALVSKNDQLQERARVLGLIEAHQAAAGVLRLKKWFDEDSEGDHAALAPDASDVSQAAK